MFWNREQKEGYSIYTIALLNDEVLGILRQCLSDEIIEGELIDYLIVEGEIPEGSAQIAPTVNFLNDEVIVTVEIDDE